MSQLDLLFGGDDDPRLRAFRAFHAANPQVYELFCRFTQQVIAAGRLRFSGRTILHQVRWYTSIETNDPAGFKVNDHWSPFYVRLYESEHPALRGFFEKRTAAADNMERTTR